MLFNAGALILPCFVQPYPAEYEIPCWLAPGYPAENAKRAGQVDIPLEECIHLNGW